MVISTDSVTNLGVMVDENLSMDKYIAKVYRAVCVLIQNTGMIRKHINQPIAELRTHALMTSRLDSLNKTLLKSNPAARLTLSRKFTHITPILKQLHWLPIEQRIIFKIAMIVFNTIYGVSYLLSLTCIALLNRTNKSMDICALQTSCY